MTDYDLMRRQLESLSEGVTWDITVLSNAAALIWESLDDINWAGFYLMKDGKLLLGPFQGKTACTVIETGKGVCGTAVAEDRTQLVKNVHEFPGHIACDFASNSEIVIPIHAGGSVYGVLDIDSPLIARFTEDDRAGLEAAAAVLEEVIKKLQGGSEMKTIYLAGGCFWGTQKFFDQFDGVIRTEVGYANGPDSAPSYEDVCASSGHAETVLIEYDEERISLEKILDNYFMVIDPVSVNRQGHDSGIQYRTGIYYTDPDMLPAIRKVYEEKEKMIGVPLAVELKPLENFFRAEEYHQKYLDKNPGGYCHIPRALLNLKEK